MNMNTPSRRRGMANSLPIPKESKNSSELVKNGTSSTGPDWSRIARVRLLRRL